MRRTGFCDQFYLRKYCIRIRLCIAFDVAVSSSLKAYAKAKTLVLFPPPPSSFQRDVGRHSLDMEEDVCTLREALRLANSISLTQSPKREGCD